MEAGQGQSKVGDTDNETAHWIRRREIQNTERLVRAVIIQAFKDMASHDKHIPPLLSWAQTESFAALCEAAGIGEEVARDALRRLSCYAQPVRREMIKKIIVSIRGGVGLTSSDGSTT